MARKGKKNNPKKELLNLILSMESLLHKGQGLSLTILMESILNYLMQKERERYKDVENLTKTLKISYLLAELMAFSKARIKKLCKSLKIPYSEDALQILEELIEEKLDYLRNKPLPEGDACGLY